MFNLLLIVAGILYLVYYLMTKNYSYWKKRGVPGPEPKFLIGNFKSIYNKNIHLVHELDDLYKEWKGKTDVLGIFTGGTPTLMILDSGIAKRIMITDFSHFADQPTDQFGVDKKSDPLMGRNPFFLKGEEWKEKRGEILPAFTSGRIKALFPIMQEVAERMKRYIKSETPSQGSFEAGELCGKYTTDVVASSIYGVESGAFTDENSRIRQVARDIFNPSFSLFFITSVAPYFPLLAKFIKVKMVSDTDSNFLIDLLRKAIEHRITSKVQRQDFLDFLIHLREKKGLSELEMAAHTVTFFFDGIETSKTTLSNIFYELAKNKSVQDKLRQEMIRIRSPDKTFEYDTLMENKYLEQVINESLRLHPVLSSHARECTQECSLKLSNGKTLTVEKGTTIQLPVYSISRDPNHYGPDANEFNPERFNDENGGLKLYKDKEVLFPFGDGPRICLGQRFALAQMKCCIAHILTTFEVNVSEKMPSEPQLDTMQLLLCYKGGVWLKFKAINV